MRLSGGWGNATGEGGGAVVWLTRPGNGTTKPQISGTSAGWSPTVENMGSTINGGRDAVITLDRISVHMSSGNITSGRMTVWGLAHA